MGRRDRAIQPGGRAAHRRRTNHRSHAGWGGHVTQAFLALTPRLGWQAYHWMIERGRFGLLGLITVLCGPG
jgi:hypothetical protein